MRHATVVTDSLAVRDEAGGRIVGYLHQNDRVKIVAGPIQHSLRWWQIEHASNAEVLRGWCADGQGELQWLELDEPVQRSTRAAEPPPRTMPTVDPPSPWWPGVVIAAVLVLGAIAYWFSLPT